ncbi:MAG: fructose-bisphosphate aldolase, partial [Crocinitomicaceae bacterium]|nr:fructose-bisphosphate aldolase [Crocinitomicaceae bacterium]
MSNTKEILGDSADLLLNHNCSTISKDQIHLPGADFIDRSFIQTNRSNQVLRNLQAIYGHGRLADTGYVSILPVDQGIEHSAGASFAPNPIYF